MATLSQATLDAITAAVTAAVAAAIPTVAPVATGKASAHTIADLREAGAFSCGIDGHGKNDDGHFATRKGATFHANTCAKMAEMLKAK